MEKVTGIGGLFFRARNPEMLSRWYQEHLGITPAPPSYEDMPWWQAPGPTVFAPFPEETSVFGRPEQTWKINFRVRDLEAIVSQLRAAGIEVEVDPTEYPNGVFAYLHDPEGNPIDLWEPRGKEAQPPDSG
jgi:glyoxylase I family protein